MHCDLRRSNFHFSFATCTLSNTCEGRRHGQYVSLIFVGAWLISITKATWRSN